MEDKKLKRKIKMHDHVCVTKDYINIMHNNENKKVPLRGEVINVTPNKSSKKTSLITYKDHTSGAVHSLDEFWLEHIDSAKSEK